MVQRGSTAFPLRDPTGGWRGMTTLSASAPFAFSLLQDCYVSKDGMEIRTRPGFKCVADPVTAGRAAGYREDTYGAVRPVQAASGNYYFNTAGTERERIYSHETHLHGFARVRDRWILFGESDFRRVPLLQDGTSSTYVTITALTRLTGPVRTQVTLSAAPETFTASSFNALDVTDAGVTQPLHQFVHLEGTGNANMDGTTRRIYDYPGGNVLEIEGDCVSNSTGLTGTINFVTPPLDEASMPAPQRSNAVSNDFESLTIWTIPEGFDPDAAQPVSQVYGAYVANRTRDFGDSADNAYEGRGRINQVGTSYSRREQKEIPFRIVPDVAADRLIMVAPGYGCVFQAPVVVPIDFSEAGGGSPLGIGWRQNDIYDKPRCLGVPKAVMWEDHDKGTATSWHFRRQTPPVPSTSLGWGGGSYVSREGTYKFRVSYFDPGTGEEGLPSEEIELNSTGAGAEIGISLAILFPGYVMPETAAIGVNVYRTTRNGQTFYFDRSMLVRTHDLSASGAVSIGPSAKFGLVPSTHVDRDYHLHIQYDAEWASDDDLRERGGTLPVLGQMPMGAKATRTIRGYTFFGGALGNQGKRLELQSGNAIFRHDTSTNRYPEADRLEFQTFQNGVGGHDNPYGSNAQFGLAGRTLPHSYAGQRLFSRTMFPFSREYVTLDKVVNVHSDDSATGGVVLGVGQPQAYYTRFKVATSPFVTGKDGGSESTLHNCYLLLPRGKVQISEPDNPGQTNTPGITVIANEDDEDIEGIGAVVGQTVIASRSKSYFLGWTRSPFDLVPEIVADRFGCIAANSMVEFDGGCAWLSDRGPVAAVGGGFRWIGQPLEGFFSGETSRYKRDSQGMMRHAWACHDAERGLLYFGCYADRNGRTIDYRGATYTWSEAPDEAKSRFPCDEVLVYSYGADAWSVWQMPAGQEVQWMARGEDASGNARVFAMLADKRVYALDDTYSDFNKEPPTVTVSAAATGTTVSFTGTLAADAASLGSANNHVRAGMLVLIDPAATDGIAQVRRIVSFTSSTLTLDASVSVTQGQTIRVGVRQALLRSTYLNPKGADDDSAINAVGVRYARWSRFVHDPATGSAQSLYANVAVTSGRRVGQVDGDADYTIGQFTAAETSDSYTELGTESGVDVVLERAFVRARPKGHSHRVEMRFIGGSQIRLQDAYMGVE